MRVVVTGAAGFIGSNLVHLLCAQGNDEVVAVDALTYAGNRSNLDGLGDRIRFIQADVRDAAAMADALAGARAVLHLAAESHVDRSIRDARGFLETNVVGTQVLLDTARAAGVERFVQVSTDEVYGTLGESGQFTEDSPPAPRSPYAASKAAADLLAMAHHTTHGLPVVVTRCSNNYGPYQFPEKLIPLTVVRALAGQPVPVYGDGRNVRDWIHVEDHCRGILAALRDGRPGRVYNFGGGAERTNLEMVHAILRLAGAPLDLVRFVADRPGHDFRYAVDARRSRVELSWEPRHDLETGLAETVGWYRDHPEWWQPLLGPEYRAYIRSQYGGVGADAGG